jgi:hypothetical protein
MRILIAAVFAAIAAVSVQPAVAGPFDIPADKSHPGVIIVAIDDARPDTDPAVVDFGLEIDWFDPGAKRPFLYNFFYNNAAFTFLRLVRDEDGHRFLVGQIGQGEAIITRYYAQTSWNMCLNKGTYHFFVEGGTYNFIGHFDDLPSFLAIDTAITNGRMSSYAEDGYAEPYLFDQKLEGLTPADKVPEDQARAAKLVAKALGHPVDILTPTLVPTDYTFAWDNFYKACSEGGYFGRPQLTRPVGPTPPATGDAKPATGHSWVSPLQEPIVW